MKTADSRFLIRSIIGAGLLLAGTVLAAQSALAACTAGNWNGGVTGTVTPGQPDTDLVARYSGVCAMQVPGGSVSFVQDNSPGAIDRIRARFYVLADNSTNAVVYRGLNSSDSPVFGVQVATNGDVTFTSGSASAVCSGCANIGGWNSIEIDWNAAGGQLSLTVNEEPAATTPFSSAQLVSSVRLGNLNGASGTMNFDAYESRRSTAVGRLMVSDANGDQAINSQDLAVMVNELLGLGLAPGQVDCNEDAIVNSQDLACIVNILLS